MVKPALILPPEPDDRWKFARQMGVEHAVIHPLEIGDGTQFWTFEELRGLTNWLDGAGLKLEVMEGSVPITDRTRLGLGTRRGDRDVQAVPP